MVRFLGVDDGELVGERILLVGVVVRGCDLVEGVMSRYIKRDGDDVSQAIVDMVNNSRFSPQLKAILTQGTTFAGFNILDQQYVYERTGLPVISVLRKKPDKERVLKALKDERKKELFLRQPFKRFGKVYCAYMGIDEKGVWEILKQTHKIGNIPEPIRLAHIIASGVTHGISKRKA